MLKQILEKNGMEAYAGFNWFRRGSCGELK
jgi:hypothetical protein